MNDGTIFAYVWLAWFAFFGIAELIALKRGKLDDGNNGGTFSELIWRLRQNKLVYGVLILFWLVLGYHFFIWT